MFFLNNKPPLIIKDAQLAPELFREIKRIVDESNEYGQIILIIAEDGILYPIEIKKSMNPKVEMVKNFYLLDKVLGYKKGVSTILCLIETKTYLKEDVIAYSIKEI